MNRQKQRQEYRRKAINRIYFSIFIVFIYILGCKIILPGIDMTNLKQTFGISPNLSFAMSMSGMNLDNFSLFSLGLGPWMSTLILWRVVGAIKFLNLKSLTLQQTHIIKIMLTILVGGIQSFMIISTIKNMEGTPSPWILVALLLTGALILIWLGDRNKKYGVGGSTVIILVAMIKGASGRIVQGASLLPNTLGTYIQIIIVGLFIVWISFYVFRFFQGERRLPLMHVMLDNKILAKSYFPVPINPAGGLPFMYSFSAVLLPQYIIFALLYFYPGNELLTSLYKNLRLNELPGVLLLMICVILLNYGFAFVNVDYKEISESMLKSGDYFMNVYPGRNTEKFLFDIIKRLATISGAINVLMIGGTMFIAIFWPNLSMWSYIIPTWMIMLTLMDKIREEFLAIYHRNDYEPLL